MAVRTGPTRGGKAPPDPSVAALLQDFERARATGCSVLSLTGGAGAGFRSACVLHFDRKGTALAERMTPHGSAMETGIPRGADRRGLQRPRHRLEL
jgi:hypothetical protein